MDTMQSTPTRRTRRYHAPDLKREVVAACQQPGASVAGVALTHGLNANLVRRWMREASQGGGALTVTVAEPAGFVSVAMPTASLSSVAVTVEPIRLELRRCASSVILQWPASAAAECGAWLRDWLADTLHSWMLAQRSQVAHGGATARALDYSLKRWQALTRFIDNGRLPINNNWIENQIRPIAIGRKNWLFAGSLLAGQRAAAIMSLIQSAKLNGHDPHAYLRDVLQRLPTHKVSQIGELLPHRWVPAVS